MARVMTGRTVLDHDGNLVILTEGDEVPEWAEDLIGDHITAPKPGRPRKD